MTSSTFATGPNALPEKSVRRMSSSWSLARVGEVSVGQRACGKVMHRPPLEGRRRLPHTACCHGLPSSRRRSHSPRASRPRRRAKSARIRQPSRLNDPAEHVLTVPPADNALVGVDGVEEEAQAVASELRIQEIHGIDDELAELIGQVVRVPNPKVRCNSHCDPLVLE